jgi:phosphoribosylaminoimidazolecarboxamide formyltransferase/IMP cyclohydrolase
MKALISVFNKEKVVEFAKGLNELGIEIIATEGTAKAILEGGIPVTEVSEITGFQEMRNIKTLHPMIHTGIMTSEIGIVAANLIPLHSKSIESIDVGGIALLKSGIKNFANTAVVVNPKRYDELIRELLEGGISHRTKLNLAIEASEYILKYELKINEILKGIKDKGGEIDG